MQPKHPISRRFKYIHTTTIKPVQSSHMITSFMSLASQDSLAREMLNEVQLLTTASRRGRKTGQFLLQSTLPLIPIKSFSKERFSFQRTKSTKSTNI